MNGNSNTSLFHINSSHKGFADRQKTLFDELDKVYKSVPATTDMTVDILPNKIHHRSEVRQFKGKESIFKRPEAPISKCLPLRHVPDFKINPHKWKKYTLNDVRDEDISEKGNRAAALSFLKELEDRNRGGEDSVSTTPGKLSFNKTLLIKEKRAEPMERTHSFKNSKVLMPEYVVGQKIKKERKNREKRSGNVTKQLTLNHLLQEDDEAEKDVDT